MQRIAHWFETIRQLRAAYADAHGRELHLFRPRYFSEKINWRKLFDDRSEFILFSDKLATREWIVARIGEEYLAPLLWTGTAEEIPFDTLTPPYFLKSSHASGQVIMVTAENAKQIEELRTEASNWLNIDWFDVNGERGYKNVPRRLMAERALLDEDGERPLERRFFVFDGKVRVINTTFVEDGRLRSGAFHTRDWQYLDWYLSRKVTQEFPMPKRLDEMIRIAELLGQGIDHVRIDFFDCGNRIFVGELTSYSWSGLSRFNPPAADLMLGSYWRLKWPVLRAIKAISFSDR
jgi:hypothetical protein